MPRDGMKAGGIFPAIVGTLILTVGTALVAIPIGVGGAIYLASRAGDYVMGSTLVIDGGVTHARG